MGRRSSADDVVATDQPTLQDRPPGRPITITSPGLTPPVGDAAALEVPTYQGEADALVQLEAEMPVVEGSQTVPVAVQPGAAAEMGLTVGATVGGRYELRALLGEGGMGTVFLAHDEVLGADVALKFVPRDLAHREQDLRRLRAEVVLAQKASHPNVCRTYDLEELDGFLFIKMEYVAGETLACRLRREGRLAIDDALDLARRIAAGLEAAHAEGVVHCDLKPENILIEHGTKRPVLMDFGIARAAARMQMSSEQRVWGTPAYMAPELLHDGSADARTDLYALGCVLYQLVVGEVPYPEATSLEALERHRDEPTPDPRARRLDLPPWLSAIIHKLLAKDPRHRYPSATALRLALGGPRRFDRARVWGPIAAALLVSIGATIGAYRWTKQHVGWHPESHLRQPVYEEHAGAPNISPDGRWLAYISDREETWRLYIEPLSGGPARALPWEGLLYPVRWAHDSQSLLGVVYQTNRVVRIPLSGGPVQEIAQAAADIADCQGRLVLRMRGDAQCPNCPRLKVQERIGPETRWREIGSLPKAILFRPMRCAPNGRLLTFAAASQVRGSVTQADIYVLDLEDGGLRRLTSDPYDNNFPEFAPDGKTIIFSSNRGGSHELWEIPVQGGQAVPLVNSSGHTQSFPFDISPDGKFLIYNQENEADQLYAYPLDGSDRRLRRIGHLSYRLRQPCATPDGHHIVILLTRQEQGYAVVLPARGGEERVLTAADAVALSADGTEVFFAVNEKEGARILGIPLGGGKARSITHAPGPVTTLAADHEGWLHLSIYEGSHCSGWRAPLAGGEVMREPVPGAAMVLPAPAGGWRLVGFERPDSWKYRWRLVAPGRPLDDPQARVFEAGRPIAWASDGGSFFSWTGTEIHHQFVAKDREDIILRTDQLNGMTVSHDTKSLFVVEKAGHTVRQVITNFADRPRTIR